jgi:hypothetical protein
MMALDLSCPITPELQISERVPSQAEHFSRRIPYIMEGHLSFKQYLPLKDAKFGIKTY